MARGLQEVKNSVIRFRERVGTEFPVRKVLLYGSYAKGSARIDSDIDVAVFIDSPNHKKRLELAAKLFHIAADVDIDIEPKCFFWDEYNNTAKGSILAEILSSAVEIT